MNLIACLKAFFSQTSRRDNLHPYRQMLADLQQTCAGVPGGKAFIALGNGEIAVQITWTPDSPSPADAHRRLFCIDGSGEVSEWSEEPEAAAEEKQNAADNNDNNKDNNNREKKTRPSKQQTMMQQLVRYLKLHYAFRYNRLTERTECARLGAEAANDTHRREFVPVDSRLLNSLALDAISEGIPCWDRDVKRYVESAHIETYHPFTLYFDRLPEWDGRDRVEDLARRVSDSKLWINSFHRWMLAVTAQWTGAKLPGSRANSVAPLLISTQQGLGKSSFCRQLLPPELRDYFTESFDLTNAAGAEGKLAAYGLINIDEFDRLPDRRMPQLKNLMQTESLHVRRAYRHNAEPLPRIASFIGTANRTDLLTDPSGSRRFICVEVTRPIDCATPVDHAQLYAQLKHELEQGERSWFSKEEEAAIQHANRRFCRATPAEELLESYFRFAEADEEGARLLSAADLYAALKKKNPAALRDCSCTAFSRLLAQLGRRVHTRYGNGYWVVKKCSE